MPKGGPPVGPGLPPELKRFLESINETQEVGEGQRGNPLDRYLKARDLIDLGLAKLIGKSAQKIVSGGNLVPTVPVPNLSTPPAPTGFEADGGLGHIFLQWDDPLLAYTNHAYTLIYRNTVDNIADAQVIGQVAISSIYADLDVSYGVDYYYWIRFVSESSVQGPFNSSVGTLAQTSEDPAILLEMLTGQITESQLYDVLNGRLDLIDGPEGIATKASIVYVDQVIQDESETRATAIQQLSTTVDGYTTIVQTTAETVDGISGQYTVKIDNNGFVSGFGLSSETVNGQTNSFFLINADTFGVVNSGASKTVTALTRSGTTATATCTAHGIAPGEKISISNVYDAGWNGSWTVATVPNANSFTFTVPNTLTTPATARIRINGKGLSSLTRSSTTATATFLTAHGLIVGQEIDVTGISQTGWNGKWVVVTVSSSTVITFTVPNTLTTPATSLIRVAAQTIPFVIDGGKVVMDGVYIKDATINDAQVGNITVGKITGVNSSFILSTIGTGNITNAYIGNIIESTGYSPGVTGWRINKDGTAEFRNVIVRGNVEATSLKAGEVFVGTIQSTVYSAGVSGWKIFENGNAEFNGVVISRPNVVASGTLSLTAPGSASDAHFTSLVDDEFGISEFGSAYNKPLRDFDDNLISSRGPGFGKNGYYEFAVDIPTSTFDPDEVGVVNGRMLVAQAVVTDSFFWYTSGLPANPAYSTPCSAEAVRVANYGASGSFIRVLIRVHCPFDKASNVHSIFITGIDWALSAFT